MNIHIIHNGMSDEELKKFMEEFAKLTMGQAIPIYSGPVWIGGKKYVYPKWKKIRDRIWFSLPVILLEMRLRAAIDWIKGFARRSLS